MSGCSLYENFQALVLVEAFEIRQMFDPMIFSRYVVDAEYLKRAEYRWKSAHNSNRRKKEN